MEKLINLIMLLIVAMFSYYMGTFNGRSSDDGEELLTAKVKVEDEVSSEFKVVSEDIKVYITNDHGDTPLEIKVAQTGDFANTKYTKVINNTTINSKDTECFLPINNTAEILDFRPFLGDLSYFDLQSYLIYQSINIILKNDVFAIGFMPNNILQPRARGRSPCQWGYDNDNDNRAVFAGYIDINQITVNNPSYMQNINQ